MENIQNRPNEFVYPVRFYMITKDIFVCSKNERMTRERLRNTVGIVMQMIYFHQFYQRTPFEIFETPFEIFETSLSTPLFKQREQTTRGIILCRKQSPKSVGEHTNRVYAYYSRDKVESYLFSLG